MLYADRELSQFFDIVTRLTQWKDMHEDLRSILTSLLSNSSFEIADKYVRAYADIITLLKARVNKKPSIVHAAVATAIIYSSRNYHRQQIYSQIIRMLRGGDLDLRLDVCINFLEKLDELSFRAFIKIFELCGVKQLSLSYKTDQLCNGTPLRQDRLEILASVIVANITHFSVWDIYNLKFSEMICSIIEGGNLVSLQLGNTVFPAHIPRLFLAISKAPIIFLDLSNFEALLPNLFHIYPLLLDPHTEFCSEFYLSLRHLKKLRFVDCHLIRLSIQGWQRFLHAIQQSTITFLDFSRDTVPGLGASYLLKNKIYRAAFCSMLVNCNLIKLDLDDQLSQYNDIEELKDVLSAIEKSKVKWLALSRCLLEDHDPAKRQLLLQFIANNHNLRKLLFKTNLTSHMITEINSDELIAALSKSTIIKFRLDFHPTSANKWGSAIALANLKQLQSLSLPGCVAVQSRFDSQWLPFFGAIRESSINSVNLNNSSIVKATAGWDLLCELVKKGKLLKLTLGFTVSISKPKIKALADAIADNFLIQLKGSGFNDEKFQDLKYRNQWLKRTLDRAIAMIGLLVYAGNESDFIRALDESLNNLKKAIGILSVSSSKQAKSLRLQIRNYIDELLWKKGRCLHDKAGSTPEEMNNAIETLLSISEASSKYESARMEIFQLGYVNFLANKSFAAAFMKAAKYLMKSDLTIVSLCQQNQRVFDGYLWKAAGGAPGIINIILLPLIRIHLLRYVQLLTLLETAKKKLSNVQKYSDANEWQPLLQYLEEALRKFDSKKLPLLHDVEFEQKCLVELKVIEPVWLESQKLLKNLKLRSNKLQMLETLTRMKDPMEVSVKQQDVVMNNDVSKRLPIVESSQERDSHFLSRKKSKPNEKIDTEENKQRLQL